MTVATERSVPGGGYVERAPGGGSSSLADVVELILDRGLVIDVFVRVSLVGIEILTVDARIVVASVDTYLRFAEATNRLDLYAKGGKDLPELVEDMSEGGAKGKTSGVLEAAVDKVGDKVGDMFGGDADEQEREPEAIEEPPRRPRRRPRERRERAE
jgi:gas vesicle structural protein